MTSHLADSRGVGQTIDSATAGANTTRSQCLPGPFGPVTQLSGPGQLQIGRPGFGLMRVRAGDNAPRGFAKGGCGFRL